MTKKVLFVAVFAFVSIAVTAQNISGLWTGRFTTNSLLQQDVPYKYELLIFQNADSITGYSYSTAGDETFYAVCEIKGMLYDGYMVIKETKTLYQNPPEPAGSRQSHILFFGSDNTEATGDWKQLNKRPLQLMLEEGKTFLKKQNDPSNSGLIKVLQQKKMIAVNNPNEIPVKTDSLKLASREKQLLQTILINTDTIELELYDDGIVDGDIVSVFFNNTVVLDKVLISDKAQKLTVHLPATGEPVRISMFAENEGSVPPNTGLLVIRDGDKKYEVRFKSDMKKSSTVELKRSR